MRDFKYGALIRGIESVTTDFAIEGVRSPALVPVAEIFAANIQRTANFIVMPAFVSGFLIAGHEGQVEDVIVRGIQHIEAILPLGRAVQSSIEAVFSAAILEAWTAVECLASDLWVAAINYGPPILAQRVNLSKKQESPDEQIAHHWKQQLEFDPRTDYAASLKEIGRVSFRSLDRIIRNYAITFENNVEKLFDETANGYIYALSAYRNVFLHNAGRVDKHFLKQIEPVDNLRGTFQLNQKLELEGERVAALMMSAISLGKALLLFVDKVITPV